MDYKTELYTEEQDDDIFYAEIRKQILLLTADDDDDEDLEPHSQFYETTKTPNSIIAAKQGVDGLKTNCFPFGLQAVRDLSWSENRNGFEKTAWHVNSGKIGNGTGVYIPQGIKYTRYRRMRRNERKGMYGEKMTKTQDYANY